jgi:dihydrofolate synthase/folylpolyglutamate synthase
MAVGAGPAPHRDLADWLQHLERLHPSTIELGLDRVRVVFERLALDFGSTRFIVVGGTNGKGSTVAMLAAILRAAGYSIGTYTSPHLLRYNERVGLQGRLAGDDELCAGFEAVEAQRGDVSLTYFEFGTLAALWLFAREPLDVVVLEIGLGGRLDAVNLIDADVCVLTNVDLDHMDWLGDTREKIGTEKAGIFRPGRPAIYGERDMPASVGQQAAARQVPLLRQGLQFGWQADGDRWHWFGQDRHGAGLSERDLPRNGFPLDNAAGVLQALRQLDLPLPRPAIERGLATAELNGRFQRVVRHGVECILDVAHNPHAARNLARNIRERLAGRRVLLVLGMLADKDSRSVVELLLPEVSALFAATLGGERGASADVLYNHARSLGYAAVSRHDSVAEALRAAVAAAALTAEGPAPVIVVAGSFFSVAAVLESV